MMPSSETDFRGIDGTHVSRANTNRIVLRKADEEMKKYKTTSNEINQLFRGWFERSIAN